MKKVNILVWLGLAANILALCLMWFVLLSTKDIYDELSYSERDVVDILSIMAVPFSVAIFIQLLSLLVLFKSPKIGLALAIIGSVIALPLSMIFAIGYLFCYEQYRNKSLDVLNRQSIDIGLNFKSSHFAFNGLIFITIGLFVGFIGTATGWLVVGAGIVSLCNSFRLRNRILIGVSQDKLIITPALYSDTYLVPLNDVSLIKENKRLFKLRIKSSGVDRICTFRKGMIDGSQSQITLNDILSKLAVQE